jgi:hypothetical protein
MFCTLSDPETVTNNRLLTGEGFGMHYAFIINAMLYAEKYDKKFIYTPFTTLSHNYDNDPNFLTKIEKFINIIDHFPINYDLVFQENQFIGLPNNYLPESKTLKTVKTLFFAEKQKEKYFSDNHTNIAIHIRKLNSHDVTPLHRPDQTLAFYCELIKFLRVKLFMPSKHYHIYSQGTIDEFKILESDDVFLHINETLEDTFSALALADVLVTASSCFSYTAGFLSNGFVMYFPMPDNYGHITFGKIVNGNQEFMLTPGHVPLPSWKSIRYY